MLLLAPVPAAVEIGINVAEMIGKSLHFGADLLVEISETAYRYYYEGIINQTRMTVARE